MNNLFLEENYEYIIHNLVYHSIIPLGQLKRYLFIFDTDERQINSLINTIVLNDDLFSSIDFIEEKKKRINANKEGEYQILHLCDYYQNEENYNVKNKKFINILINQPIREDFQNTLIEKWNFPVRRYLKKEEIFFKLKNK